MQSVEEELLQLRENARKGVKRLPEGAACPDGSSPGDFSALHAHVKALKVENELLRKEQAEYKDVIAGMKQQRASLGDKYRVVEGNWAVSWLAKELLHEGILSSEKGICCQANLLKMVKLVREMLLKLLKQRRFYYCCIDDSVSELRCSDSGDLMISCLLNDATGKYHCPVRLAHDCVKNGAREITITRSRQSRCR